MFEGRLPAEDVFSDAWQQVVAGRSIESVLADYPECAAELEPMLRLTKRVGTLSELQLSPAALSRIRERTRSALVADSFQSDAEEQRLGGGPHTPARAAPAAPRLRAAGQRSWLAPLFSKVRISMGALLLLLIGAMLTSAVVVWAVMRLSLPANDTSAVVAYGGTITRIEESVWQVDDMQVYIDDATQIHGQSMVGATMHCIAQPVGDNKLKAIEIWVRPARPSPATPTLGPGGPSGTDQPAQDLGFTR